MKKKAKTDQETILQQNGELEDIRVVCAKSLVKLTHVGEQLKSLMKQQESYILECQRNPFSCIHRWSLKYC